MGTPYIQDFASLNFPRSIANCKYLIIGKIGVGKSATGNTLLGMDLFKTSFVRTTCLNSVTNICERSKRKQSENFEIEVMDTPGLMDPRNPPNWAESIIARSMHYLDYKPNVILYVIRATDRIVEIDEEVLTCITKLFGPNCFKYMIVVFSCEDQLDGRPLAELLLEARHRNSTTLFSLLEHVGARYLTITNRGTSGQEKNKQILELLKMTQKMMVSNNPQSCTCKFRVLDNASKDQRFVRDIPIPPPPPPGNYCSLF